MIRKAVIAVSLLILQSFIQVAAADEIGGKSSPLPPTPLERVNLGPDGAEGNLYSAGPAITPDGRYVTFFSRATTLIEDDDNFGIKDVFVRDREQDKTSIVSVTSGGLQCRCPSRFSSISADGRYVAFNSLDSGWGSLTPNDDNTFSDVFVRDLATRTTELVSVATNGSAGNGESAQLQTVEAPSISSNGRFVAFGSRATNLVVGDNNRADDVFVRDLATDTTERISVGYDGSEANGFSSITHISSISGDGRYVVFYSQASNLVPNDPDGNHTDLFIYDREKDKTSLVVPDHGLLYSYLGAPSISDDGRYVVFSSSSPSLVPGDTNGDRDVFVRDLSNGGTRRVSVSSQGQQGTCENCYWGSYMPTISKSGRYVIFHSGFANLVPKDTNGLEDVFVHDLQSRATKRVNVSDTGEQTDVNGGSYGWPGVSDDGGHVFFADATNLVPHDTNETVDVFAR